MTRVIGVLIILSFLLPSAAHPELPDFHEKWDLPDSHLGKRLGHLFEALSRDDETFTREFINTGLHPSFLEMGPVEVHLEQLGIIAKGLGRFEVDDIDLTGPYRAELVLRSESGDRKVLMAEIEEIAPYRLVGIGLKPHDPDLELPEFSTLSEVDTYLQKLAAGNKFSGVVLVDQRSEPRFLKAYGMANKTTGVPNSAETRFNVGSITKSFTAVSIMQLVEEGKLDLDDPMSRHLEGFPPGIADRVTVRQLLRMESGYGDYFESRLFEERRTGIRSIEDLLEIFRTLELEFEPGTDRRYSNVGYVLLGGIIESASRMTYFDYVDQHIFRAADMKGSSFPDYAANDRSLAMGYTNDGPAGEGYTDTNLDLFTARGNPSGGSYSTATDLLLFNRALRGNRLLSELNTTLLLNFFTPGKDRPHRRGVAGGAPGVSAVSLENADLGTTVIVLSNYDEPFGEKVGQAVFRMLGD